MVHNKRFNKMSDYAIKYNEDGTITYWSVYNQVWVNHADNVPHKELAAMPQNERNKVTDHLSWAVTWQKALNPKL